MPEFADTSLMINVRRTGIALATLSLVLLRPAISQCTEVGALSEAQPNSLTGTIFETSSGTNKTLYTFHRSATRTNVTVYARRDFLNPDGSLAAREQAILERGRLVSFELDERQTGARGFARVTADPKNSARQRLVFDWITREGKKKTNHEVLQPGTLVGDMIPDFIVAHWRELSRGNEVPFRFIVPARLETVGLKLVKESDVTWRGQAAVRLRMEASNFIIAQIVDPIFFIVEENEPHRVLEYIGRTTPKQRDGNNWKDLDARTIYDWR